MPRNKTYSNLGLNKVVICYNYHSFFVKDVSRISDGADIHYGRCPFLYNWYLRTSSFVSSLICFSFFFLALAVAQILPKKEPMVGINFAAIEGLATANTPTTAERNIGEEIKAVELSNKRGPYSTNGC